MILYSYYYTIKKYKCPIFTQPNIEESGNKAVCDMYDRVYACRRCRWYRLPLLHLFDDR